ncbi:hypothetical protein B0H13DRAFT_1879302 [Mycena leptocephala]|nr:hypothetical protein B0H13DRAFT_1879302 [Mycena leptocephala]
MAFPPPNFRTDVGLKCLKLSQKEMFNSQCILAQLALNVGRWKTGLDSPFRSGRRCIQLVINFLGIDAPPALPPRRSVKEGPKLKIFRTSGVEDMNLPMMEPHVESALAGVLDNNTAQYCVVTTHPQGKSENTTSISSSTPWVVDFGISVPTNNASRIWNTIIIGITFELSEVVQKFRCRDDIGCGLHDNTPSRAGFCCDRKKTVTGQATHLNLSPRTQTEVTTCQVATFIPQNPNTSCNLPGCNFYPPEPKQKLQLVRLRCPSSPRIQTEVATCQVATSLIPQNPNRSRNLSCCDILDPPEPKQKSQLVYPFRTVLEELQKRYNSTQTQLTLRLVNFSQQIKTIRIGVPRLVPRARQCPPQTSMDGCMYENFAETACSVLDYWIWLPRVLEPKHLAIVLGALPVKKWKWTAQRREDL